MEELEQDLKDYLLNMPIKHIEFYALGASYLSPNPESTWLVNGGVQFQFENDSIFSFAFSTDLEFFDICKNSVDAINENPEMEPLDAINADRVNALIGKSIQEIAFKWNFYQEYDEDFELKEEKNYMPDEMILTFDSGSKMQLAAVNYTIFQNEVRNLHYESAGELLISIDHPFDILPAKAFETEEF